MSGVVYWKLHHDTSWVSETSLVPLDTVVIHDVFSTKSPNIKGKWQKPTYLHNENPCMLHEGSGNKYNDEREVNGTVYYQLCHSRLWVSESNVSPSLRSEEINIAEKRENSMHTNVSNIKEPINPIYQTEQLYSSMTNILHRNLGHSTETCFPDRKNEEFIETESSSTESVHKNTSTSVLNNVLTCKTLDEKFKQNKNLNSHQLIHDDNSGMHNNSDNQRSHSSSQDYQQLTHAKPLNCDKRPSHTSTLRKHLVIETGKKYFACNVCHKNFAWGSSLKNHHLTHTGEKRYKCNICEKRFIQKSDLKRHHWSHTSQKLFKCDLCVKRFTLNSSLRTHRFSHYGVKLYKCDICKKKFTQSCDLKKDEVTHICEKCVKCD